MTGSTPYFMEDHYIIPPTLFSPYITKIEQIVEHLKLSASGTNIQWYITFMSGTSVPEISPDFPYTITPVQIIADVVNPTVYFHLYDDTVVPQFIGLTT